ncbi:hypothetical protein F6V25_14945 [Oryzomonas japonica]|uniref:Uncharacterized protein n=1 Tax=Oryzomonas japonica TaxID=2603858 RepID=A0A7J4ZN60_9BACT|nr:hypothetical protein [Oryzomonas japonica]KAB0664098.1 hypothetical protein F6V25_14945 [Oryzomonas japonica]
MTTYPITTGGTAATTDTAMVVNPVPGGTEAANSMPDSLAVTSEAKAAAADTVTLLGKDRSQAQAARKDTSWGKSDKIGSRIGAVLFTYNSKGDLRIRFMDSTNTLVYQTPPVMMARMMDLMMHTDSSVSALV